MFGGYLRSQVRCTKCKYNSNTYDPFLDLSLEVSGKKVHSLHDALSEFTRKETLDAANKWKCSGCKKRVCATKQLTIFRPPLTLCIQLKRFTFGGGFGGFMQHQGFSHFAGKGMGRKGGSKVQKLIEFPATLKLPLSDGRKCEYILTGVIVHIGGSATSGHYTAFVRRTSKKGKTQWLNMDDSFVEPVSEKTVLRNDDAYVLFYCRKEVDLELPSLPGRSFDSAEDAVKAVKAKSKSKIKSPTDNSMLMSETKEKGIPVTPESIKKKSKGAKMQVTLSNKDARKKPTSDVKKDVTTQQSPEKAKKESRNVSKEEDKREIASSAAAHNSVTSKHSEASDDTPTPTAGALDSTESSSRLEQVDPTSASAVEGQKSPGEKKKRKKTDITIDLGSRGKVNVKLGKLKNRKPWKSPSVAKSSEDKSHLLGNKTISGWDDEDEGGGDADADADARTVNKKQKAKKLRESVFKESKQKAKDRKRKMYLNSWDAGLDSGKVSMRCYIIINLFF
jgi:ubiquitin carboxyl-terminal hydrolase 36/42